jgi:hypothetical protein
MLFFLDIDGVMVPSKGWKSPEFLNDGFPAFSVKATNALQSVLSDDVTIMLTTSHKSNFSIQEWIDIFKNRGINIDKIKTLPQNSDNISRKDEIINWFNINKIDEYFVIIDDDKSLNELPHFLKVNLVQTSPQIGLTEEHTKAIKSIFQRGLKAE